MSAADDLRLLRRLEPVLRFAEGERFVPTAVDGFVRRCSLRAATGADVEILVPEGGLSLETLAAAEGGRPGTYLQFVSEKERAQASSARWRLGTSGQPRLARVGLFGRIADALYRLSLVVRQTVPRGVAAAAARKAHEAGLNDQPVYYARVVRDGGWIVLHYQFFYAMNDWRSAFGGVNDHESDWEQIMVFCEKTDRDGTHPDVVPRWLAYASHDHDGDDLRRAWDDPAVTIAEGHPVVFVGGGSHASYFEPGAYVTRVDIPPLRPMLRLQRWFRTLAGIEQTSAALGIPFIDSAPGDGHHVGPGTSTEWEARLLDPDEPWVADFRGLWGLDTADVTGGERAPAGPRFNRDGTVRTAWADPVGYAGLQKVTPPGLEAEVRTRRLEELHAEREQLSAVFEAKRRELRAGVLVGDSGPPDVAAAEAELAELRRRESELESEQRRLHTGAHAPVDSRAHLVDPAIPEPPTPPARRRLLTAWSAISAPLLIGLVALTLLLPSMTIVGLLVAIVLVVAIESLLRRRLVNFVWGLAVVLAIVGLVWLALLNWQIVVGAALGVFALVVLWANVRELLRQR